MKKIYWLWSVALLCVATTGTTKCALAQTSIPTQPSADLQDSTWTSSQIIEVAQQTSEAQLQALTPTNRDAIDWISGVMWTGIGEFATVSNRSLEAEALRQLGEKVNWKLGVHPKYPFHADDDVIGQAFFADYARRRDQKSLTPLRADIDLLVARLRETEAEPRPMVWWWCDALFMAPPVLARLSALTGERKYLDVMDKEWWKTTALLYDPEEHLFFRDRSFLKRVEKNGQKMFWSRGNGWVLAGLARVLTYMPKTYPSRPRYEKMFRDMSARLVSLQGKDGMWRASLLDPASYPTPESSGTAFYCYGLSWGINNGLLPRKTYEDSVTRAWAGLVDHRRADKLPGFVQSVGAAPGPVQAEGTHLYATGGFLLAATEMAKLSKGVPSASVHIPLSKRPLLSIPTPTATINAPTQGRAFVRHVPERKDDIAWENNRIAFRIYGPELEKQEKTGSGVDVWVKSTRRLVMGKGEWYAGNYHKNQGEGLDFYQVGQTRGCGGLGVWDGKKLDVSRVWLSYRILESGPNIARFEVTYAPWQAGSRKIWEKRIITLDADSNLNRIESTLHSDQPGEIMVGIGIAKTQGDTPTYDAASGLLASWAAPTPDGSIGCGILVDPQTMNGSAEDELNHLILVRARPGIPFIYYAGAVWDKSGYFPKQADWLNYLKTFRR